MFLLTWYCVIMQCMIALNANLIPKISFSLQFTDSTLNYSYDCEMIINWSFNFTFCSITNCDLLKNLYSRRSLPWFLQSLTFLAGWHIQSMIFSITSHLARTIYYYSSWHDLFLGCLLNESIEIGILDGTMSHKCCGIISPASLLSWIIRRDIDRRIYFLSILVDFDDAISARTRYETWSAAIARVNVALRSR